MKKCVVVKRGRKFKLITCLPRTTGNVCAAKAFQDFVQSTLVTRTKVLLCTWPDFIVKIETPTVRDDTPRTLTNFYLSRLFLRFLFS